jgi:hypothetical protein
LDSPSSPGRPVLDSSHALSLSNFMPGSGFPCCK